jgi:hypothetical protein
VRCVLAYDKKPTCIRRAGYEGEQAPQAAIRLVSALGLCEAAEIMDRHPIDSLLA